MFSTILKVLRTFIQFIEVQSFNERRSRSSIVGIKERENKKAP
jgi:hypothetical protein